MITPIGSTQGFKKEWTNLLLNRIFNLIYVYWDNRSINLAERVLQREDWFLVCLYYRTIIDMVEI